MKEYNYILPIAGIPRKLPGNVIRYKAKRKLAEVTNADLDGIYINAIYGNPIVSHTFSNGIGTIIFRDEIINLGYKLFAHCANLIDVTFPDTITNFGNHTFYSSNIENVDIPSGVTTMGSYVFYDCKNLEYVEFPSSITSYGSDIFTNCTNLKEVKLSKGCSYVGYEMFLNCTGLNKVDIPYGTASISSLAFGGCTSLKSLDIPSTISSISWAAFKNSGLEVLDLSKCTNLRSTGSETCEGCTNLKKVILPEGFKSIPFEEYYNCTSLEEVILPSTLESIGDYAFAYTNIKTLIIPENVTSILDASFKDVPFETVTIYAKGLSSEYSGYVRIGRAFGGSGPIINKVIIGENIINLRDLAFYYAYRVREFVLPETMLTIGNLAFYNCTAMETLTIPDSVITAGSTAFHYCENLKSVKIGKSYTTDFGYGAPFPINSSIETITVDEENPKFDSRDNCNAVIVTETNQLVFASKNAVIPNGVVSIAPYAFTGHDITSIVIPESVTELGSFRECRSLSSITILGPITSIPNYCFSDCESLTSIAIPETVTSITDYAFLRTPLTSIHIPASVNTISDIAFAEVSTLSTITVDSNNSVYDSRDNCNAIIETNTNTLVLGSNSTIIPNSITSIGNLAFESSSIGNIVIPNSVTTIGNGAFKSCPNLTTLTLPNSVILLGSSCFYDTGLTTLTFPGHITVIPSSCFYGCNLLTSVIIEEGVEEIKGSAFGSLNSLETIVIPSTVTNIAGYVFNGCLALTSITCNATTAPTITSGTFLGIAKNGTLYVPTGSTGYDTWMSSSRYYLRYYYWTKVEQ